MSRELSLSSPSGLRDGLYKLWRKFTAPNSETALKTGAHWIDDKPIYRKIVDMGALANTAAKSVAHGITGIGEVVMLSGIANDNTGSWNATLAVPNDLQTTMTMDSTNVTITSASDLTAYDQAYAIIEYTLA